MDHLRPPKGFPLPQLKLSLTRLSLVWQIFGGNDFSASQEMACNTRASLEQSGLCLSPEASRRSSPRKNHHSQASNTNSAVAAADRLKVNYSSLPSLSLSVVLATCSCSCSYSCSCPCSLLSLLPAPCSLLPALCSLLPTTAPRCEAVLVGTAPC